MSFKTELTVDIQAEDADEAYRLRLKVEVLLMGMENKLPKGGKLRWFCSKPAERVPEKTGG